MRPTTNRKKIVPPGVDRFMGYKINSAKSGVYAETMKTIINQLEACRSHHGRILVVRFDLHSHGFKLSDNNKVVSLFMKRIVSWVERNYSTNKIGRLWVRECERAKHQHYHCALMIDGDKIRHPKKLLEVIKERWEMASPSHHMPYVPKPYHFVDKHSGLNDSVYRLSYFAKCRGKGYRPDQAKDFSASRITPQKALKSDCRRFQGTSHTDMDYPPATALKALIG